MSNSGSSGDASMIRSMIPVPKKVKLPVPNRQSTPIGTGKKMEMGADGNPVESGLQNLNSRFAEIIDRNNQTMNENKKLKDELETVEDLKKNEINQLKKIYESELAEARRLLDKEAVKSMKEQLELSNLRESNQELKVKTTTLKLSEEGARILAEDLQAQVDHLKGESATMRRKTQDAESQKASLLMQLTAAKSDADELKCKLDEQAMALASKGNMMQSKQEEHHMAIRVLRQELEATRSDQASAMQRSVNEKSTFNSTMSTAIEDIRSEHAETLKDREREIKGGFAKKLKDLEGKIDQGQRMLGEKRDEASKQKALHDQAKKNSDQLERELNRVKSRSMNLEADVASQKAMAEEKVKELKSSVSEWQNKFENLDEKMRSGKDQYHSLLKEVETYRSLLEVEENRLNIEPSPIQCRKRRASRGKSSITSPPQKRALTDNGQTAELEVSDVGANGDAPRSPDSSCSIM